MHPSDPNPRAPAAWPTAAPKAKNGMSAAAAGGRHVRSASERPLLYTFEEEIMRKA